MRMTVTVKQGIIPNMEHFTTKYDYSKVHENNIQKTILMNENQFKIDEFYQEGTLYKRVDLKNQPPEKI